MSRANTSDQPNLTPMDAAQAEQPQNAGVFRLETMAPGVANADQFLGAPPKRRLSTQAMALAVLLLVGGGLLYGMRLLGIGPLTSLGKTTIPDYDLTRTGSSARSPDNKKILEDLAVDQSASQVPLTEVRKNPFKMSDLVGAAPEKPGVDPNAASRALADKASREAQQKKQALSAALAQLKVNSVIGSGNFAVARIGGEAVRVGGTVGDAIKFTVKAIHGRTVEIEREGQTYELNMDDDAANSNKKKK